MPLHTVNCEKLSVRAEERRLSDKQETHGMGLRKYIKDNMVIKLFEKENYQGVPGRGLHWIGLLGITDAVGE